MQPAVRKPAKAVINEDGTPVLFPQLKTNEGILPQSRVRSVGKSIPGVNMLSADAVTLLTRLAELYIGDVTTRAVAYAQMRDDKNNITGPPNMCTITASDIMESWSDREELDFLYLLLELSMLKGDKA